MVNRDRITGDDIIATSFIYMSQISGQGEEGIQDVQVLSLFRMLISLGIRCPIYGNQFDGSSLLLYNILDMFLTVFIFSFLV